MTSSDKPASGGMSLGAKLFLLGSFLLIPTIVMNLAGAGRFDPARFAEEEGTEIEHPSPRVPPFCVIRDAESARMCWTCHDTVPAAAARAEGEMPWSALLRDDRAFLREISEGEAIAWASMNNLADLWPALQAGPPERPKVPPLRPERGIDSDGFLQDRSGFRAVRQTPWPFTGWPSLGAFTQVWMRLDAPFHRTAEGTPSRAIAILNHELVRAAVRARAADLPAIETPPLDERLLGVDLDGDGAITDAARAIRHLPANYAGSAASIAVRMGEHPLGTEFVHLTHAAHPGRDDRRGIRVRELRYAKKVGFSDPESVAARLAARKAPNFPEGDVLAGFTTALGWRFLAFAEDPRGRLRHQSTAEMARCFGCHENSARAPDGAFSTLRQLPGSAGFGLQDLRGMKDMPTAAGTDGELLQTLRHFGRADPLREDHELEARLFDAGRLREELIQRAAPGGDLDLADLLLPSRERTLELARVQRHATAIQTLATGSQWARPSPLRPELLRAAPAHAAMEAERPRGPR